MFTKKKAIVGLVVFTSIFLLALFTVVAIDQSNANLVKTNNGEVVNVNSTQESTTPTLPNLAKSINDIAKKYTKTQPTTVYVPGLNDYIDNSKTTTSETPIKENTYKVLRVVDGDTFVIDKNGSNETIRMIGMDTPESVNPQKNLNCSYGKVASKYTTKLLTGKEVNLEFDSRKTDTYGRTLAYVYVDNVFINLDLVKKGYAVAKSYYPNNRYEDELKNAQIEAESAKYGMWADDVSNKECNLKEKFYISQ